MKVLVVRKTRACVRTPTHNHTQHTVGYKVRMPTEEQRWHFRSHVGQEGTAAVLRKGEQCAQVKGAEWTGGGGTHL